MSLSLAEWEATYYLVMTDPKSSVAADGDSSRTMEPPPLSSMPPVSREEDEYSEDSSSASSMSSTGTIVPTNPHARRKRPPASWEDYFEKELYLDGARQGDKARYHVYLTSPKNPAKDPLFVCHHGAGACGLSFALFTKEIRRKLPRCGVLAVEARDHGSTVEDYDSNQRVNLSLAALSDDLLEMINLTVAQLEWPKLPTTVLLGHSLGGAVVTHLAKSGSLGNQLLGSAVVDVVEGSAMEALKMMQSYLNTRPTSFQSVEDAIDWHVRSRTIRNPESAQISTPPLLVQQESGAWTWRTDLSSTSAYWEDWFTGMSSAFLAGKGAKLLILAGTDRLDKELMIGQMQGKFQLVVLPEAGHFVQEDIPERTAEILVEFFRRNDRSALVLPPKVSDLIAQGKKV